MASGTLGVAALAANTNTTVYTVPANRLGSLNISVTNRAATTAIVDVAISTTGTPANSEYIEFGVAIPGTGILERTAIVAEAGKNVVVRSTGASTSVRVHGYEEVV